MYIRQNPLEGFELSRQWFGEGEYRGRHWLTLVCKSSSNMQMTSQICSAFLLAILDIAWVLKSLSYFADF